MSGKGFPHVGEVFLHVGETFLNVGETSSDVGNVLFMLGEIFCQQSQGLGNGGERATSEYTRLTNGQRILRASYSRRKARILFRR